GRDSQVASGRAVAGRCRSVTKVSRSLLSISAILYGNIFAAMRFLAFFIALLTMSLGVRAAQDPEVNSLISERHTNGFKWEPLVPGRDDASIAIAAARTLEHFHYAQLPFDDEVSSKFLDKYLDA